MPQFKLSDETVIDTICVDNAPKADGSVKRIPLRFTAVDEMASGGQFVDLESQPDTARKITRFIVQPKPGAIGKAAVYGKNSQGDEILLVRVGKVTNHDNFTVDLFADLLGRSEDPKKLLVYQRALDPKNNSIPSDQASWDGALADQPLKQITNPKTPGKWNCGAKLQQFGASYLGSIGGGVTTPYYSKLKSGAKGDVIAAIDPAKMTAGVEKIKGLLDKKKPVIVFVSHHYPVSVIGGMINPTGHTHFLSIVGYGQRNGKLRFLCLDPWPGGSVLSYTSGIFGNVNSKFMGVLEYHDDIVDTPASVSFGQGHDYLVVAGP